MAKSLRETSSFHQLFPVLLHMRPVSSPEDVQKRIDFIRKLKTTSHQKERILRGERHFRTRDCNKSFLRERLFIARMTARMLKSVK